MGRQGPIPIWDEISGSVCGSNCYENYMANVEYSDWEFYTREIWNATEDEEKTSFHRPILDISTLSKFNPQYSCSHCKVMMSRKSVAKFLQWVKTISDTNIRMVQCRDMLIKQYGENPILSKQWSLECDIKRHMQRNKDRKRKTQTCLYCNEPAYTTNAKVCSRDRHSICNQKRLKERKSRQ